MINRVLTVQGLIDKLNEYDKDMKVMIATSDIDYQGNTTVEELWLLDIDVAFIRYSSRDQEYIRAWHGKESDGDLEQVLLIG